MEHAVNRQWRIARRPEGLAKLSDFEWHGVPIIRSNDLPNDCAIGTSFWHKGLQCKSYQRHASPAEQ